ncbi:hypothetical protein P378_00760 [Desulforamulus profundi]|uniref:Uncharacterized protein n=1 Tax=Desulforamulus profundi TaxID=1383067 RepID=A0A2C6MJY5_9FIRM|nr:hypothetical protein P378_00760 [Desulforamulus profundi]
MVKARPRKPPGRPRVQAEMKVSFAGSSPLRKSKWVAST